MIPTVVDATVYSRDASGYRVSVVLGGPFGSQMTSYPVDILINSGYCDAVRGNWPPLPAIGTRGRVLFTNNDLRNGVWIGAVRSGLVDSSSHSAATPDLHYCANFDGSWFWHGQDGTVAFVAADGTQLLLGAALPQPTRHTLSGQTRQTVPFTQAERNPSPPAAFPASLTLANGVSVAVTAAGALTVSGLAGQPVTVVGGGCSLTMAGGTITLGGTVVATGDVIALAGAAQVKLGAHLHSDAGGSGNSGPPVGGT